MMMVHLKCNIPWLNFTINGVARGGRILTFTAHHYLPTNAVGSVFKCPNYMQRGNCHSRSINVRNLFDASQREGALTVRVIAADEFTPLRQANVRFHSRYYEACQLTNRFHRERSTLRRRQLPRFAVAMDKMEITDEQMLQEKQRIEQEETFLGKEELPEVAETSANGGEPEVGAVGSELLEVWDLWQRIGLPVEKIAKQKHMSETGVFYSVFTCIQNNYTVDWYELCKEAQFTLEIANRMIQATETLDARIDRDPVDSRTLRHHLPDDVSEVHFGLFVTMLVRSLPFETIREISFKTGGYKPEMEWGEVYADEERFPKEVTERNLLQWFAEKEGASMIEIALKFRECDELELMRLILKLEEEGKIFLRQGIFRVLKRVR